VPSFAFNTRETRRGHFAQATDISQEMSGGDSSRERIRISVVHALTKKAQLGEVLSRCRVLSQGMAAYRPAPRVAVNTG